MNHGSYDVEHPLNLPGFASTIPIQGSFHLYMSEILDHQLSFLDVILTSTIS